MISSKILFCINVDYFIFASRIYTFIQQESGVPGLCRFCDLDRTDYKRVKTLVWLKS